MPDVPSKPISPPPGPLLCREASSDEDGVESENKTEAEEWETEMPELSLSQIEHSDSFNDVGDAGDSSNPKRRVALYGANNRKSQIQKGSRRMKKCQTTWVPLSLEVRQIVAYLVNLT